MQIEYEKRKRNLMVKKKYKFTSADLKLKRYYEKELKKKIPDEQFYKYIQKSRKWLKEFVKTIKKWIEEKPVEVEQFIKFVEKLEREGKLRGLNKKISKIKKLNIAQLKKHLLPHLKKEGYIKLEFSKPEIEKDVIISFMVQDNKTDRGEYDSRIQLQRIIKKTLENTNWRLMSDGINYRLGILSGRLKGYED